MTNIKKIFRQIIIFLDAYKVLFLLVFAVIMLGFVNDNSIMKLLGWQKDIKSLEAQKIEIEQNTKEDRALWELLDTNNEAFERYVREKFYFHKPNEDVYVIRKR